jgi:type VI protein secretion system component VasK
MQEARSKTRCRLQLDDQQRTYWHGGETTSSARWPGTKQAVECSSFHPVIEQHVLMSRAVATGD